MEQPILTIAIPNKNGETFLPATMASLAANRPFVRWWFQDAVSRDASVAIAESFRSPQDTIQVEKDNGQADGINRAIDAMGGDIICYLNSDDCLAPGAAQSVLETFAAHPEVDLVYGNVEIIDAAGNVLRTHSGRIDSYDDIADIYNVWWKNRQWVQPEVFWRRRLWDKVGSFNNNLTLAFDFEYWVRALRAGCRVKHIPRVLSQFRIHAAQKSTNASLAASEIRRTVISSLEQQPLRDPDRHRRLRRMLAYDCFHSRESFGPVSPDNSFLRALALNPAWLSLEPVRARLRRSFGDEL